MALTAYATTPWLLPGLPTFGGMMIASDPTIVVNNGIYHMYFTDGAGDGAAVRPVIAGAVSPDGQTWTPLGGTATTGIVLAGAGAAQANLEGASIFKAGDAFILLYSGYGDIGDPAPMFPADLLAAVSTDGITFTPVQGGPVLARTPGGYDNDAVFSPTVIAHDGGFLMLYAGHAYADGSAFGGDPGVRLLAATSPDGLTWTKVATPVLEPDPGLAWMSDGVAEPSIVVGPDGNHYLFFTGLDGADRSIGLAVAPGPLGPWDIVPSPIITAAAAGMPAGSYVIAPHAELVDGVLRLWYTQVTPDNGHAIAYAEADWGGGTSGTIGLAPHWLGTALDDVIDAGATAARVVAAGGNDLVVANGGRDTIDAGDGDDRVWAGGGDDTVRGGAGDDYLVGGAGFNTIDGGAGADIIAGDAVADRLSGGAGGDLIDGGGGADLIDSGADDDEAWGGAGDDSLLGGGGLDTLLGGEGADTLDGADDADLLVGDIGADRLSGGIGDDLVDGGDDADTVVGGDGEDQIWAGQGDDSVVGGLGRDTLFGDDGADALDGAEDSDVLAGQLGADRLLGGSGDDVLDGGADADHLTGGDGLDVLDGGEGGDTLDGGLGADVIGAGGADGDAAVNLLLGGAGHDLLFADAGRNTLDGGTDNDTLMGGSGDERLVGGTGADLVDAGAGDDTLMGGAQADWLHGGAGIDLADYSAAAAITVSLADAAVSGGDAAGDVLDAIEHVTGSAAGADLIIGNDGANRLEGLGGNDTLDGGGGGDVLVGGAGGDLLIVNVAADVVLEAANGGNDTVWTSVGFALAANVETLVARAGLATGLWLAGHGAANTLIGAGGADTLDGGAGADSLAGGAGSDFYIVDHASDRVLEAAGGGTDALFTSVGVTLGANVESLAVLAGVTNGLALTGNAGANVVAGGAGADTVSGAAGADSLSGGAGDDLIIVDNAGDLVSELAGGGNDTVQTSVSYALGGNLENLVAGPGVTQALTLHGSTATNIILGGAGHDLIVGGGGNDQLAGGAGNDTINGGNGLDRLSGGAGNDRLFGGLGADAFIFNAAPNAATNVDRIVDFTAVDDAIHLENAVFTGLGGATGVLAAAAFRSGAGVVTAGDASDRIIFNTSTGDLYYDADGAGGAAAIRFARIENGALATAADFLII